LISQIKVLRSHLRVSVIKKNSEYSSGIQLKEDGWTGRGIELEQKAVNGHGVKTERRKTIWVQ
jgi:hypothetical protein